MHDVAGKIIGSGAPNVSCGVEPDCIAKGFPGFILVDIQRVRDEGKIDAARAVQRDRERIGRVFNDRRRRLADHVVGENRGLGRFVLRLVVILKRGNLEGVGIFSEKREVGHPPQDDGSAIRFEPAGDGLECPVDGSVARDEGVVGDIEAGAKADRGALAEVVPGGLQKLIDDVPDPKQCNELRTPGGIDGLLFGDSGHAAENLAPPIK